jgi:CxxC-x17-CxxC domain-containing protein
MKKTEPAPVARRKTHAKKKKGVSPRHTHGTRVAFRITCERCKAEDTLPFVPKNASQILCSKCAEAEFGADWDKGRSDKVIEHEFECASCARASIVSYVPDDPEGFLCSDCVKGIQSPDHSRLVGAKSVGRSPGVMRRKQPK